MTAVAAAIVDSRNVFHQGGDAIGVRGCPSVKGVRTALARYGFDVVAVHVGLALARLRDRQTLAAQHAYNETYRQQVLAEGGQVLLGELHCKPNGKVEEKMVDGACNVRIARYVDEILYGRSSVETIVVLSKDIDLTPAVQYAVDVGVPITVAGLNVIEHRPHPYALLGPHAYAEIMGVPSITTGHERREFLARALQDGMALTWTVKGPAAKPRLVHACGLIGLPAPGTALPAHGRKVTLYPVDVTWDEEVLGSFPLVVCSASAPTGQTWSAATVRRRTAPMTIEVSRVNGHTTRVPFPMGGVVPGDTVLIHESTNRALGRLVPPNAQARQFNPDQAVELKVYASLPKGGALASDGAGRRGLVTTNQVLKPGDHIPAVQIDEQRKGPVWAAIGTPIP